MFLVWVVVFSVEPSSSSSSSFVLDQEKVDCYER